MNKDFKNTNLIYKVVDGEVRILGVMDNTNLAKKYVDDLNNSNFCLDGKFVSESVRVLDDSIPFELIQKSMVKKHKVKKYAEVVGRDDFSEVRVLGVSEYNITPKDYQDSDGIYHVFFELTDEDINSPMLNGGLIKSFCEVVSDYSSCVDCTEDSYEYSDFEGCLNDVLFRKGGNVFTVKNIEEFNRFLRSLGIPEGVGIFK